MSINLTNAGCQTTSSKKVTRPDAPVSLKKQDSSAQVKNYRRALMGEQSLKQFGQPRGIDTLQTVTTDEPSRSTLPGGATSVPPKRSNVPLVGNQRTNSVESCNGSVS